MDNSTKTMVYSFESLYWQSPSDSDLFSTKFQRQKKSRVAQCTYPSLPDVVGRRLNLFRSTSLSPGDSRAPWPILPPLRSSWNSAVSWAAQKVSKHLIKKYMCNFCICSQYFASNPAGLLRTPAWLGRQGAYWDPYSAVSGVPQIILKCNRQHCRLNIGRYVG